MGVELVLCVGKADFLVAELTYVHPRWKVGSTCPVGGDQNWECSVACCGARSGLGTTRDKLG